MNDINLGSVVTHEQYDATQFKVVTISRGWYTIRMVDDWDTEIKARYKQLLLADSLPEAPELDEDESEDDELQGSKLERTMKKYRDKYVPTLAASGKKSLSNGDELAMAMAGLDHIAVAFIADAVYEEIGKLDKPHWDKYRHLNNGQIRMNSGNRIRGAIKRGDITLAQVLEIIATRGAIKSHLAEDAPTADEIRAYCNEQYNKGNDGMLWHEGFEAEELEAEIADADDWRAACDAIADSE